MEKKEKVNKILFIIFLSLFTIAWVASLVFLGFSVYSEEITDKIQTWYASRHEDTQSTLNLLKVSTWSLIISTGLLLVTLLMKELKKKYK